MVTQVSARALKKVNLFRGLAEKELAQVAGLCREHSHKAGELCVVQGQETEFIHIIKKGKVGIESQVPDVPHGRKEIILATLTDGEVFSWSALMNKKLTASVRAIEPTDVLDINADELIALCEENNHIGYIVMKNLSQIISSRLSRHRLALMNALCCIGEGW